MEKMFLGRKFWPNSVVTHCPLLTQVPPHWHLCDVPLFIFGYQRGKEHYGLQMLRVTTATDVYCFGGVYSPSTKLNVLNKQIINQEYQAIDLSYLKQCNHLVIPACLFRAGTVNNPTVNVCIHDIQEQTSSSNASQSLMNKCVTAGPENESQKMKSLIFESLLIKG